MFTLRDHNVADYAALRDMDTTDVALLDQADRAWSRPRERFSPKA